jgi:oxygen-independent coproporphyrinogen-3 oxidase
MTLPLDVGLYVHVAFCQTKCFYCDFNTYAGLGRLIEPYTDALEREIRGLPPALPGVGLLPAGPFRIGSVFFGGGTPSLLALDQVNRILTAAREWSLATEAEITVEINPDDPSVDYFRGLRSLGVNRISLGVQTLDDQMLRRLGRRHDAATAVEAYERARASGFDNVSLDLMFGLPEQTLEHWERTLDQILRLGPEHLSLYNLTIEPDTPFASWHAAGTLSVPDDDLAADMYQAAIDRLGAAGYAHYEISNWAKSAGTRDLRAQHNLRYWRNQPYFGVGAGAHSSYAGFRYANLRSPQKYIAAVGARQPTADSVEPIDEPLEQGETMMLGLRLSEGVSVAAFQHRFGRSPEAAFGDVIAELREVGLLEIADDRIQLTPRGRFLGNEVFCRFLPSHSNSSHSNS